MKEATLSQPLTVSQPATKLRLRGFSADVADGSVTIVVQYIDASGALVQTRHFKFANADAVGWIGTQEDTILNYLLAQLGLSGAVGSVP
jgi:hypothetical protein